MNATTRTPSTTLEERTHVAASIIAILNDLQPRRAEAMRQAAEQVKTALAGTWFHDAIVIPDAADEWEQVNAPCVDLGDGFSESLDMDFDMWESFRLFSKKVPPLSSLYVAFTVDRLCPGPSVAAQPEITDWNLVHDFASAFVPRVSEVLGEQWAAAVQSMWSVAGLENLSTFHFQVLVNAPNHRFWRGGPVAHPSSALKDSFAAYNNELKGYVGRVLSEAAEHIDPSDAGAQSLRSRLAWVRSSLTVQDGPVSGSTNLIWRRITNRLIADPDSTTDELHISDAIIECFPTAVPAVGRYLGLLETHPDLRPEPPAQSLSALYDQTIVNWEAGLPAGQVPLVGGKDSRLNALAESALQIGATTEKAAF